MKHPNGGWRLKQTGKDSVPAHPYANTIPTNQARKASKPGRINTRHSSHGTSTKPGC